MTAGSSQTRTSAARAIDADADALVRMLPAAGCGYVAAWILGLVLGPSAPSPGAPAAEMHAFYVDHAGGVLVQSFLVHGLAGIGLVLLALGFARALPTGPSGARWIRATGLAAALVSFVQVALAAVAVTGADTAAASTSKALFSAVNHADTVKLLLLACFATVVTRAATRAGVLAAWVRALGYLLGPLLVLGGLAFVVDDPVLYLILVVSLFVLLAWVASASWMIGRRRSA